MPQINREEDLGMRTMHWHFRKWLIISCLPAFCLYGVFTAAQTAPTQTPSQNGAHTGSDQDRDITRRELANFDEFLDAHREIAEQVRKDPSLLDNQQFLKDHPVLQTYLWNHPGVREEVKENPTAFMHQENRYEHAEDAAAREKLASFDQFLDKHREVAERVRKDPSLLDNQQFLKDHPELQAYLQDHSGVRNAVRENPAAFMQQENRYERNESEPGRGDLDAAHPGTNDGSMQDRDITRRELANFDEFLDAHREIAEQVRRDPSLLKDHPVLQTYLWNHPGVREEVKENPTAFMHQENRYERTEDAAAREKLASFDQFLDKHREIAEQVRKDPSLLDNQQFLKNHPALQAYLQDHSGVRNALRENPSAFMSQENRYERTELEPRRGDPDAAHRHFGEFLGSHTGIARDLSKDASLVKKDEYMHSHPELQAYLSAHPEVREQLMTDPAGFCKSSQQFTGKASVVNTTAGKAPTSPAAQQPKP
jgi:phage-related protein